MDLNLGQLFLAGFDGTTVDESHPVAESVIRDGLGGVILFDRNIDGKRQNIISPEQLQRLTGELQAIGSNSLLIAVDQEGGNVCRLKESDGFVPTEPAASFAGNEDSDQLFQQAEHIAKQLKQCGINFNLAPVVDLNLNPDNPIIARYGRSFGSEPDLVAQFATTFINAHHAQGVACCIKHFPGHGSASADSHLGFVDISECWQEKELEPYRKMIAAGGVDAVMTAHVVHNGLDADRLPATLSRRILGNLLRKQLGYEGVVVSDDLQMKAISEKWGFEEAVQRAVLAGVDLLIVGNNLVREEGAVKKGIRAILDLVETGRIDENVVLASLKRVAKLKQKITGEIPWKMNQPII